MKIRKSWAPVWAGLACATAFAQTGPATHTQRLLTPEAAQKVVQAALQECRKQGFQVAVAVVDRSGVAQAMVRDRFAGAHTPDVATNKAWTAVSFRTETADLARATQPGQASSGLRNVARFTAVGGGVPIRLPARSSAPWAFRVRPAAMPTMPVPRPALPACATNSSFRPRHRRPARVGTARPAFGLWIRSQCGAPWA